MKIFGSNDIIFARATVMGHELLNIRLMGVSSMEALLKRIKSELENTIGIVTINIRNLTQGWNSSSAYRIA